MSSPGHILIVGDDPDFVAIYRDIFEKQGLQVTVAHSADDGTEALETLGPQLDVVLLDQKLQGRGGPDSGLDLITRAESLAPFAKTIVVTGYATAEAIERAFQLGVYDYIVKNGAFAARIRAKVRNAIEVTSERRLAALAREGIIAELRSTWSQVRIESDRNRKGKLLEELVKLLFRATPGFERVTTQLDNKVEEIDIVVENRANDGPWKNDGTACLRGECKNWSKPCGSAEYRNFHDKLTTKYQRARTGFFFAPGGFTSEFHEARSEHAANETLVIPVDAADLERWIEADDRVSVLGELHQRAAFATKG
ncbi:response regulator [Paraliomyxa miuraensis]|uniref:response regulator n=1 Tax=Paraliomyxa miuraensis TaxID=376150 RepID=UPI00224CCA30|nr:response regulator [Paraliomyxa miuraensis]MCX4240456.1 response regulator [Paraliomyxa miuraensis]